MDLYTTTIVYFVGDDMTDDFPLIARDFYLYEFANIAQYEDLIEAVKLILSR